MNDVIYMEGVQLDLDKDFPLPYNYSIADAKDPNKRKRNYSKRIKLPGTQTNLDQFYSAYSLTITDTGVDDIGFNFDSTRRVRATAYKKGLLVFDGLIELNEVTLIGGDYFFECTLYSNFVDIFLTLGDMKIAELGWGEYDHALNRNNIKNSWDTSVKVNGVDTPNFTGGVPDGFGYVYPLVDYGFNTYAPSLFRIDNIIPLVYAKEVAVKCFGLLGITIDSDFMDSDLFKKLTVGWEGGKRVAFSPAEIASREVDFFGDFQKTDTFGVTSFSGGTYRRVYNYNINMLSDLFINDTEVTDITNQYQSSNGAVTIQKAGTYKFDISWQCDFDVIWNNGQTQLTGSYFVPTVQYLRNGVVIFEQPYYYNNVLTGSQSFTNSSTFNFNSGDTFQVVMRMAIAQNSAEPGTFDFTIASTTDMDFNMTCVNTTILDGDTVTLSTVMPDMKCADFLKGLITAFNLYLSDPDIDNVVKIEPLTDYYLPTNQYDDWTGIVDHSKEIKITPASTISGKSWLFEFESQDDFDNKRYFEEFQSHYGNKRYEVESSYVTGERSYKLPFGQAVPIKLEVSNVVLPRMIKEKNDGSFEPYKGKPKLYFYNGMKSGTFRMVDVDQIGYEDLSSYPCVHHFDDFENPTFDLNFELPQKIYYGNTSTVITTANLFSVYHEKFIREITGRDSKFVNLFAKLDAARINTLNFRKLIMWRGSLFRLNEIKDFDSDRSSSTAAELIRVIEGDSPNTQVIAVSVSSNSGFPVMIGGNGVNEDVPVMNGGKGISSSSKILKG